MKVTELLVVQSKDIKNPKQLKEVFRDKCGVQIDTRVYTTAESILEVGQTLRDLTENTSIDNQIATVEFCGMYAMALAITNPEEYKSVLNQLIEEEEVDITPEEAAEKMLQELEEYRNQA